MSRWAGHSGRVDQHSAGDDDKASKGDSDKAREARERHLGIGHLTRAELCDFGKKRADKKITRPWTFSCGKIQIRLFRRYAIKVCRFDFGIGFETHDVGVEVDCEPSVVRVHTRNGREDEREFEEFVKVALEVCVRIEVDSALDSYCIERPDPQLGVLYWSMKAGQMPFPWSGGSIRSTGYSSQPTSLR